LPTASFDPVTSQPISIFPAPDHPAVVLGVFAGNLGLDTGAPQSVYTLDTSKLKLQASQLLYPGDTLTLPNHLGSITFVGYSQWVTFQITHDPGKAIALIAACFVIVGLLLSLGIRRRRVWVRASARAAGRTVVEVGGLARTDAAGAFDAEFARLVETLRSALPALPADVERAQVLQGEED